MILGPLIEAMSYNESLVNVKLVGNVGHTSTAKHKIALCLLKNLEIIKNENITIKSAWLDLKQIEVLDDQLDEFLQGFSFVEKEVSFLSKDGNREI